LVRYDPTANALARRLHLFHHHNIRFVFDIGANEGQYGSTLREAGFKGMLVSFEPLSGPFKRLEALSRNDGAWSVLNLAVSDRIGAVQLNVDGDDGQCSSLLPMEPSFAASIGPQHRHQTVKTIEAITLDEAVRRYAPSSDPLFVKMDVQGFEGAILAAATISLGRIEGLQLELSLAPLYRGELPLDQMLLRLRGLGFSLEAIEPGAVDATTGRLLQADCLFFRTAPSFSPF
jgi:FkbM family methyltransferase